MLQLCEAYLFRYTDFICHIIVDLSLVKNKDYKRFKESILQNII
jgi:hypothetical protein